ncbi:MAG: GNAT family N-acetyltransferase [Lautropia sp.]
MNDLRPMRADDIASIVAVIADHDEDDGAAAAQTFARGDLRNLFVLEHRARAAGVSGWAPIAGSDGAFWLSWTYLDRSLRGRGHGRRLVAHALDELRYRGARKVFVKVSDYRDDVTGDLYGAARRCYARAGFEQALFVRDYYDAGENLTILALELDAPSKRPTPAAPIQDEYPAIEIERWFEIDETDGAWTLAWRVRPGRSGLGAAIAHAGESAFNAINLERGLALARDEGARAVFLSFPSNLPRVVEPLAAVGLEPIGRLPDFHGRGLHEQHFARYFE